jgi:hypothetical protein
MRTVISSQLLARPRYRWILVVLGFGCSVGNAGVVTFHNLHPDGSYQYSTATSVFGSSIGGWAVDDSDAEVPGHWSGASADFIPLQSVGSAKVRAIGDGIAAGEMGVITPTWNLSTGEYQYIPTENVVAANVYAISGRWAGGQAVPQGGHDSTMAVYWDLDDISQNGVVLTPFGGDRFQAGIFAIAQATATSPGTQVGFYGDNLAFGAALWNGTVGSLVELHPTFATDRQPFSVANAAYGSQQGGFYGAEVWDEPTDFLDGGRAVLWEGSAASATDIHPDGYDISVVNGMTRGAQVGTVATFGSPFHEYEAFLWTENGAFSLHDFLSPEYLFSWAFAADWVSATELWIVGSAINELTAREEAILWVYTRPVPEPSSGFLIMLGLGVIAYRYRRRFDVALTKGYRCR